MRTVVGFLSRPHGFNVLEGIIKSHDYSLIQVYTHSLNPKSQDPSRSKRSDFDLFAKTCAEHNIPLITVDSKNFIIEDFPQCDFIVEVSWRYLIPHSITKKANILAFGLHRGKLPDYAGAEPIKQALLHNENEIFISAHSLDEQIDAGKVIRAKPHPVHYNSDKSLDENIQRLRDEITPLFSKLALEVMDSFKS